MKNLTILSMLLFLVGTGLSMASLDDAKIASTIVKSVKDVQDSKTVKLKITGMTCAGCNNHVHKLLSETEGVLDNSVEYPGDIAIVQYNPEKISPKEIIDIIQEKTNYLAEIYKES